MAYQDHHYHHFGQEMLRGLPMTLALGQMRGLVGLVAAVEHKFHAFGVGSGHVGW